MLTLRYRDYPRLPKFTRHRTAVALLSPRCRKSRISANRAACDGVNFCGSSGKARLTKQLDQRFSKFEAEIAGWIAKH